MPKRKASQCIDEWLQEGKAALKVSRITRGTESQAQEIQLGLTAEGEPAGANPTTDDRLPATVAATDDVAVTVQVALTADVAVTAKEALPADVELRAPATTSEEAAATWFWELLIQAGYEPV